MIFQPAQNLPKLQTGSILCYFYIQMPENSIEKIAEKVPERMICESCGGDFLCGAKIGECWCSAVKLEAETLAELRDDYKNCLCSSCLCKLQYKDKFYENSKSDRSRLT